MQCVQKICALHWILWHPQVETQLNDLVAGHHLRMRLILWNKMKKVHHCIFALKFKLKFFYLKLKPIDCIDNHTIFESTLYYCFHYCTGMPLSSFDHMKVGLWENSEKSVSSAFFAWSDCSECLTLLPCGCNLWEFSIAPIIFIMYINFMGRDLWRNRRYWMLFDLLFSLTIFCLTDINF